MSAVSERDHIAPAATGTVAPCPPEGRPPHEGPGPAASGMVARGVSAADLPAVA